MEYIILDTNVFIKENFLEGTKIKELFKLSEEEQITIILTKITIEEIKNNYKKFTNKALKDLGEFKNLFESRVLRNHSIGNNVFSKLIKKDIISEFNNQLDELLIKSKIIIIDYTELNIKDVFERYFKNEYPFNSADKKSEFPDAFALGLIEKWCIDNNKIGTIFSSDKDFLKFKSKHLTIKEDYTNYLDEKLKFILEKQKVEILENLFIINSNLIDSTIKEWYIENLNDENLYYSFVFFEIHQIEVSAVEILNKTYKIVAIEDESIEIEVEVELTFSVDLEIDDEDFSHYDDEDKITNYYETKTESIERTTTAKISMLAYINDEKEFEDEFEILEINQDKKLKIEAEFNDYR